MKKENIIKSLFCYRDENVKKTIWAMKTDKEHLKSEEGKNTLNSFYKFLIEEIRSREKEEADGKTIFIIVSPPSTSYWQNKKIFDHMNIFLKKLVKDNRGNGFPKIIHIANAIVPNLVKKTQKILSKKDREINSIGAYRLSNYFKYKIKTLKESSIKVIIIDDISTTGLTLDACSKVIRDMMQEEDKIMCLSICYEP